MFDVEYNSTAMKTVTLDTFQEKVMKNEKVVLLEFHGNFCSACAMMEPLLLKAAEEYGKKIDFMQADADHEEMLNTLLNVRTLPAVFLFKQGKVLAHYEGFLPETKLHQILENAAGNEEE